MYKLNDVSNESKDYINLYNMIPSLKLNNPKKEKRNSLNLTNLSKPSINLRKKSLLSENSNNTNSINKIQKIKDFMPNKENSYNKKKDSISFKGTNFPICLSFMTNSKNYINSINKKFKVRNFHDFTDYKAVSDKNNSSLINNNSHLEKKNGKRNIFYLKLNSNKKSKEIKKLMSKINFSMNSQNKNKINNKMFLESENNSNNSAINIKNYNYFIGTIDKSINFFDQKQIFKKKENLKRIQKIKNTKFNDLPKPKKNYMDLFMNTSNLKLDLSKKKLQNILTKKLNLNLNTSADVDLINKETSINDSKKSLKPKSSSKISIPKIEINNNKSEKEEIKEKNIEKMPEKKSEKTGIGGLPQLKKKIENKENKENKESNVNKPINKNFTTKVSFAKLDEKKDQNDNEVRDRKKKFSNRKSSMIEKVLQKRILYLHKKSQLKNKMKFFDLVINKRKNNIDKKSYDFLNDLIEENNSSIKIKPAKFLKESKNQIILSRKKYVDRIISTQSEKLKYDTYNYFSKYTDLLTMKKNIMSSNTKIFNCRFQYFSFKKNSILHILLYSYISIINKCGLDINLKNYIYSNLDFSSINLPEVDQDNTLKQSLILGGIKRKKKENNEIFSTVKTKFIESKKYKYNKMVQNASLYYIIKELDFYNILKTVNYLENENDANNGTNNFLRRNKININNSPASKTSILRRKKSKNYMTKRVKYTGRNNSSENITRVPNSLSILEDKKFFSKEKGQLLKRFRNSVSGNLIFYKIVSKNNFKRMLTKGSEEKDISDVSLQKEFQYMNKVLSLIKARKLNKDLSYSKYDLLKQIKDKENIESILRLFIIEGESMLFIEYFNDVLKRIDINSKDSDGNTFLILSIKSGMNYVSKLLLDKGANPNIQNYEGNSALHFALSRKNFGMADLLKFHGAKEDVINKRGYNPWECLGKSIENAN